MSKSPFLLNGLQHHFLKIIFSIVLIFPIIQSPLRAEEESLCAVVKIEIRQEITLERQAFDAHMRIKNGLTHTFLENVSVEVLFTDENRQTVIATSDASDTSAAFFIREDSKTKIDNVTGTGVVEAGTTADIHWMIIPSPGASAGVPSGKLYYVGAKLTYTIGGEENITVVTPDYIYVKPMPDLTLDYFLPEKVYGDDAFTTEIEPPIPFSMGLRILNKGFGTAKHLKIDSAQPRIVDNEQGLLVGFSIIGSEVQGDKSPGSLLVDFGDIQPESAASARFTMTATLSGRFTAFNATFSHSDELGGELTSLIQGVQTHALIGDVLVDLPGRDAIGDFLARDGDIIRIYETDATETIVTDHSAASQLTQTSATPDKHSYTLGFPVTQGFAYTRLPDPENGAMALKSVVRSDGKIIKPDNFWRAKQRKTNPSDGWDHFIHLFDSQTTSFYTITFESKGNQPKAPYFEPASHKSVVEQDLLDFTVQCTDPDNTIPSLFVNALPFRAAFTDQKNGTGVFSWAPVVGQAGKYPITFTASDGVLEAFQRLNITVFSIDDTDGDGMNDSWEMAAFGTLARDGSTDFDGDGILDLDEFLMGSDPGSPQSAPSVPVITSPAPSEKITGETVTITIENSTDADGDTLSYTFELYGDERLTDFVEAAPSVPETPLATGYVIKDPLIENQRYTFRVRASDGYSHSLWTYGEFFIDRQNESPGAPLISFPADGSSVDTLSPAFEVTPSIDKDFDVITYDFAIYEDQAMTLSVGEALGILPDETGAVRWQTDTPLADGNAYFWQVKAVDARGLMALTPVSAFSVNLLNHAPSPPSELNPTDQTKISETFAVLSAMGSTDEEGDTIRYIFELDRSPDFNTPFRLTSEGIDSNNNSALFEFSNLMDNTRYHFRVKASDGESESLWVKETFFVNLSNNAPKVPTLKNPGESAWTDTMIPTITLTPTPDPDLNPVSYEFEIYQDKALMLRIAQGITPRQRFHPLKELPNQTFVYLRVRSLDTHNAKSAWSAVTPFFINDDGVDTPPEFAFTKPVNPVKTNAASLTIEWVDEDPDSNAELSLYYDTDQGGKDGVLITDALTEDPDGEGDRFLWDVSDLNGVFYIYAVIKDQTESSTIYAPYAVTLDKTAPIVTASPAGGTFQGNISVTLSTNETAIIHYALNGSTPTLESPVFTGPVLITEDTTLTAIAVDETGNPSAVLSETYTIEPSVIAVRVQSSLGYPLTDVKVQAFKTGGSYAGFSAVTDANGTAVFAPEQFTEGSYTFRILYLRIRFFSEAISIPGHAGVDVTIEEAPLRVSTLAASETVDGVKVYLYSEDDRYLQRFKVTDETGEVVFNLPVGYTFKFRTTLFKTHYFTETVSVAKENTSVIELNTGGGIMTIRVEKSADLPLEGIPVYLFSEQDKYLGSKEISSETGEVRFKVSEGTYKVRANYLGYRFFSEPVPIITDTTAPLTILHQPVSVLAARAFKGDLTPAAGIKVFLFTESGKYVTTYGITDESGVVIFDLPEKAYKVRLDDFRTRFWSDPFTWQDTSVVIPTAEAKVIVTGAGLPQQGLTVFAFNGAGAYLGLKTVTDTAGMALFRLPEGTYQFRVKYMGNQYFSPETVLLNDTEDPITLSVGGGEFTLLITDDKHAPIEGVTCHVYNASGQYIRRSDSTDQNGAVHFDLAAGSYEFKAVYLSHEYMSTDVIVPSQMNASIIIAHESAETLVSYAGLPAPDAKIYLYSESGKYLGLFEMADSEGKGLFDLPVGKTFLFRSDILKRQYFSPPLTITSGGTNQAILDAGGGLFQVRVQKSETAPLEKIPVYLFGDADRYTGKKAITDPSGLAGFHVPKGDFKVRADYMRHRFLSTLSEITGDTTLPLTIPHKEVVLTVQGSYQGNTLPIKGSDLFLMTPTDHYTGYRLKSDTDGKAVINLPEVPFYFKAKYQGHAFISPVFTATNTPLTIPMANVTITVTGGGMPSDTAMVYLYSDKKRYLGVKAMTDSNGSAQFDLPVGAYQFKANYQKQSFWSAPITLSADTAEFTSVSVGGGNFTFTLNKGPDRSLPNVKTHVFNSENTYLGVTGATDDTGKLLLRLSDGTFILRMSYLNYHFWTPQIQIPETLDVSHLIPHREVTLKTLSRFQSETAPIAQAKVHLFSESDRYVGLTALTDGAGTATFDLPEKIFKARLTYLKKRHWSAAFNKTEETLMIDHGKTNIQVNRAGSPLPSKRVYLFDGAKKYLGVFMTTDASGSATRLLPEDSYFFQLRLNGQETFSQMIQITKDTVSDVLLEAP